MKSLCDLKPYNPEEHGITIDKRGMLQYPELKNMEYFEESIPTSIDFILTTKKITYNGLKNLDRKRSDFVSL